MVRAFSALQQRVVLLDDVYFTKLIQTSKPDAALPAVQTRPSGDEQPDMNELMAAIEEAAPAGRRVKRSNLR